MDRVEMHAFAWALVEASSAVLDAEQRAKVCITIGVGELESAIRTLLDGFVKAETALPPSLLGSLWAWIGGFTGTDGENDLQRVVGRIRISPWASATTESVDGNSAGQRPC